MTNRRCLQVAFLAWGAAVCLLVLACEAPYRPAPFVPKAGTPPPALVCHDAIGHRPGSTPWIYGGTCCCTPTRENYALHIADGTIDRSISYEDYLQAYATGAIVTDLDHTCCGNYCSAGPHVTLGGKCMATPIVGTAMYERATYGPHSRDGWAAAQR